jgi:hypothetical protein
VAAAPRLRACRSIPVALLAACSAVPRDSVAADCAAEIGERELRATLRAAAPGTAPGPDGVTVQLYRRCAAQLVSLLVSQFADDTRVLLADSYEVSRFPRS